MPGSAAHPHRSSLRAWRKAQRSVGVPPACQCEDDAAAIAREPFATRMTPAGIPHWPGGNLTPLGALREGSDACSGRSSRSRGIPVAKGRGGMGPWRQGCAWPNGRDAVPTCALRAGCLRTHGDCVANGRRGAGRRAAFAGPAWRSEHRELPGLRVSGHLAGNTRSVRPAALACERRSSGPRGSPGTTRPTHAESPRTHRACEANERRKAVGRTVPVSRVRRTRAEIGAQATSGPARLWPSRGQHAVGWACDACGRKNVPRPARLARAQVFGNRRRRSPWGATRRRRSFASSARNRGDRHHVRPRTPGWSPSRCGPPGFPTRRDLAVQDLAGWQQKPLPSGGLARRNPTWLFSLDQTSKGRAPPSGQQRQPCHPEHQHTRRLGDIAGETKPDNVELVGRAVAEAAVGPQEVGAGRWVSERLWASALREANQGSRPDGLADIDDPDLPNGVIGPERDGKRADDLDLNLPLRCVPHGVVALSKRIFRKRVDEGGDQASVPGTNATQGTHRFVPKKDLIGRHHSSDESCPAKPALTSCQGFQRAGSGSSSRPRISRSSPVRCIRSAVRNAAN